MPAEIVGGVWSQWKCSIQSPAFREIVALKFNSCKSDGWRVLLILCNWPNFMEIHWHTVVLHSTLQLLWVKMNLKNAALLEKKNQNQNQNTPPSEKNQGPHQNNGNYKALHMLHWKTKTKQSSRYLKAKSLGCEIAWTWTGCIFFHERSLKNVYILSLR